MASCSTLHDLGPHDALEPVKNGAGAQALERARPLRSVAQTHRIVVPVRVAKPQEQAPGRLEPQRIDELLAQQAHRRGAENDDPLLVQADDALIRTKVEDLAKMEVFQIDRLGMRQVFHIGLSVHSIVSPDSIQTHRSWQHYAYSRQEWPVSERMPPARRPH